MRFICYPPPLLSSLSIPHQVLSDAETNACIKMLLRWQGCYDADKMESDTHLVRAREGNIWTDNKRTHESSTQIGDGDYHMMKLSMLYVTPCGEHSLSALPHAQAREAVPSGAAGPPEAGGDPKWDARQLLVIMEQALFASGLLPPPDLRAAAQQAHALLFEAIRQQHDNPDASDSIGPSSEITGASAASSVGKPSVAAGPAEDAKGHVGLSAGRATDGHSPHPMGHGDAPMHGQLMNLNDLALMVDFAQVYV